MPVVKRPWTSQPHSGVSAGPLYLDDSKVAILGVRAQVKDVPFHVNGGWKTECDKTWDWTIAKTLKSTFPLKEFKVIVCKYFHNCSAF